MGDEPRSKVPVDFELVLGHGVHPFYLGMEADQVMEAAVGWRIAASERDFGSIRIEFEKGRKTIDVSLVNTVYLYPGFDADYRAFSISTNDAKFPDGNRLSRMNHKNILSRFVGEHAVELKDFLSEGDDIFWSSYESEDIMLLFNENLKPLISVSRMPKFPWDSDE